MIERLDDTIVAISSPPGASAMGIVRLSGEDALRIADAMVTPSGEKPSSLRSWSHERFEIAVGDGASAPARVVVFRAPKSYTRQDLVEIHTIGSPVLLRMICDRAEQLGATQALPGEFTARAMIAGAMSASRAEGVAALIHAESDTELRAARRLMTSELAGRIADTRGKLAETLALVEADIDFAEEPIDFISPDELRSRVDGVNAELAELLAGSAVKERIDDLPRVLIVGPPNAGKSTLLNRLSGRARALAAAVAGTTRDLLTAPARFGEVEAILIDSAGIDDSADEIIARARELVEDAASHVDLILMLTPLGEFEDDAFAAFSERLNPARVLRVRSKCDLDRASAAAPNTSHDAICVSAATGEGLPALSGAVERRLRAGAPLVASGGVIVTRRQESSLMAAGDALDRAVALAAGVKETIDCAELLAFELREAMDALGEVSGEITTEDLLLQVFANFCIGK